jgi:allantoinase
MPDFDLLTHGALNHPFIGIVDGRIAALTEGTANEVCDATGRLILPGVMESHVHFGGIVPGNCDRLEELRDRGVIGLKAFMSNSGIDDFPRADLETLRAGMQRAAEVGLLVAVHAELEGPGRPQGTSVRDYLASRPIEIEVDAIRAAGELAGETGCKLHIVHVSSAAGVAFVGEARKAGVDITCETCPHYLVLTEDDMERLGAVAKCAPPLRSEVERRALLEQVRAGHVTTIGSDHSPSPAGMKTDPDFFKVWGGISGCQHLLALLFELDLPPARLAELTSTNVARRFGLAQKKGAIEVGLDADLVFIDPVSESVIERETLHYRHRHTPYLGRKLRAGIVTTLLRGEMIYDRRTRICGPPRGQLLTPHL